MGMSRYIVEPRINSKGVKTFRVRATDPGTGKYVMSETATSDGAAHTAGRRMRAKLDAGYKKRDAPITLTDYVTTQFWDSGNATAANTDAAAESHWRLWVQPKWGHRKLSDITTAEIQHWVRKELRVADKKSGTGTLASGSQKNIYMLFHKMIRLAVQDGALATSPLPRESGLPTSQSRKVVPMTAEQISKLAAADPAATDLILTGAYGGFRLGELLALRADDLNFDKLTIQVDEQVIVKPKVHITNDLKRARSQRVVPMPDSVMAMLEARCETMGLHGKALLFPSAVGREFDPRNWRRNVFKPAAAAAGVPGKTPHDLRHHAASVWFEHKVDLLTVARYLGEKIETAESTYIHLITERDEEIMAALDVRIAEGLAAAAGATNVVSIKRRTRRMA